MQRRIAARIASILFCVGLASPAGAALLTLTGSTLTVAVGAIPPVTFAQNVASIPVLVSSGGGSFTEPAGIFTGTAALPTSLFTGIPIINGLSVAGMWNSTKLIAQGAQPGGIAPFYGIHRAGGGLGGSGALSGRALLNVLGLFNLAVPLYRVGSEDAYSTSYSNANKVTLFGTGWTTGNVTLTGLTTPSGLVNTMTFGALGFDNRTPGHRGVVQLVSPFKVVSGVTGNLPGYALQTLTFAAVPEPGRLSALALGAVALVAYGRSRGRS